MLQLNRRAERFFTYWFHFLLIFLGVGLWGHYGSFFCNFLRRTSILFSIVAGLICMYTNSMQWLSSYALIHNYFFRIVTILTAVGVYFIVVIIWISLILINLNVFNSFILYALFEKYLLRSYVQFLSVIFSLPFSCMSSLHIFDISHFLFLNLFTLLKYCF